MTLMKTRLACIEGGPKLPLPKRALHAPGLAQMGDKDPLLSPPEDQIKFLRRLATQCVYSSDWPRKAERSKILSIAHHASAGWSYLDLETSGVAVGLVLDGYVEEETAFGTTGYTAGDMFVADFRLPSWFRCNNSRAGGGETVVLLLDVVPELFTMSAFLGTAQNIHARNSRASTKNTRDAFENILTLIDAELYDIGAFRPEAMMVYIDALQNYEPFEGKFGFSPPFIGPDLSATIAYLRANFSDRLKYGDLSGRVGISRSRINRNFQDSVGMSPLTYHQVLKSIRAKHLFEDTDLTCREIALHVGAGRVSALGKMLQDTLSFDIRSLTQP